MAIFRQVQINYWQDAFILELNYVEKFFYLYLISSSKSTQCGIYEITKSLICLETGLDLKMVNNLLNKFMEYGKIVYSQETNEIFIKNWIKHNKNSSPKAKKCVEKEIRNVKSDYLKELFYKECKRNDYEINIEIKDKNTKEEIDIISKENIAVDYNVDINLEEAKNINIDINKEKTVNINNTTKEVVSVNNNLDENKDESVDINHNIHINKKDDIFTNDTNTKLKESINNKENRNTDKYNKLDVIKGGATNGVYSKQYSKPKHATTYKNENAKFNTKPTEEELQYARELTEQIQRIQMQ